MVIVTPQAGDASVGLLYLWRQIGQQLFIVT